MDEDPIINFRSVNLERVTTPHDDTLVIWTTIANYDVARVFEDSRSSINFLFKEAFDHIQIDPTELRPLSTSLLSFARHEVQPLGQVSLPLSLGEEPLRRTRCTIFMVIETTSP